jgi:class 3 adenylate cyclase
MKWKVLVVFVCWITISVRSASQTSLATIEDTSTVNAYLAKSKALAETAPDQAIAYNKRATALAKQIGFIKGEAQALKNIGIIYFTQGKHLDAINYWKESLEAFKAINDLPGVSNMLNNIGVIYSVQGDYEKALANYLESLKIAEQSGDKIRIVTALNNVGATYGLKPETYDKALKYYLQALPKSEEIKDANSIGKASVNIGEIYSNIGNSELALSYIKKSLKAFEDSKDEVSIPYAYNALAKEYYKGGKYDLALRFHNKAYNTAKKVDNKLFMVQSLLGLADTYMKMGNPAKSLNYYTQAETYGREINALDELKDVYHGMFTTYASIKNYSNAFKYQSLYTDIKDSLYNIETNKKLASLQFDFDLQKKQGEIDLLTKDKSLKELELQRKKLANNALAVGLILIFIIAFIIFRNYLAKARINKLLDFQKAQIEHLLLNILPAEVAGELQQKGVSAPRHYNNVSVLFTDFKSFTMIADKMPPQELVEELNHCFIAFDNIIEKYNLEKIKTIGDSYMCAGGIPTPDDDHPFRIIKAAMEIREFIHNYNRKRAEQGLPVWDIRIGIHVGPVVAGVVGKKKYAYDIWGSTVNIASRMESNGEPGQINVSAATCEIIKDKYICKHRGKVYAKNVGEIDMYFIEGERDVPDENGSVTLIKKENAEKVGSF